MKKFLFLLAILASFVLVANTATADEYNFAKYTPRSGDNPSRICRDMSRLPGQECVVALLATNNISDPRRMRAGREILVPTSKVTPVASQQEVAVVGLPEPTNIPDELRGRLTQVGIPAGGSLWMSWKVAGGALADFPTQLQWFGKLNGGHDPNRIDPGSYWVVTAEVFEQDPVDSADILIAATRDGLEVNASNQAELVNPALSYIAVSTQRTDYQQWWKGMPAFLERVLRSFISPEERILAAVRRSGIRSVALPSLPELKAPVPVEPSLFQPSVYDGYTESCGQKMEEECPTDVVYPSEKRGKSGWTRLPPELETVRNILFLAFVIVIIFLGIGIYFFFRSRLFRRLRRMLWPRVTREEDESLGFLHYIIADIRQP